MTALLLLLLALGLSAGAGGLGLVSNPTGRGLGMEGRMAATPFPDLVLPGLILGVVFGAGSLAAAWGVHRRAPWSWYLSTAIGAAHLIWLRVQVWMIGPHVLQAVYGLVAVGILATAALPPSRAWLVASDHQELGGHLERPEEEIG